MNIGYSLSQSECPEDGLAFTRRYGYIIRRLSICIHQVNLLFRSFTGLKTSIFLSTSDNRSLFDSQHLLLAIRKKLRPSTMVNIMISVVEAFD